jgi:SAM-dependent methyltransferase
LLRAIKDIRPDLILCGVEPAHHARRFSEQNIPDACIHVGLLPSSPFASSSFDLISCVGVFEHVGDPVGFAKDLATHLGDEGYLFVSVPNLADNPADVVTFDHLSRFTPTSFRSVLGRAGLIVEEIVAGGRVPMWALARRPRRGEIPSILVDDFAVATNAAGWFKACLHEYSRLSKFTGLNGGKVGVYGTGLIFPAAVALGEISSDDVVAFFDDNAHMHGSKRLGRAVLPLSEAADMGVTDITFSANPVYVPRMECKVKSLLPHMRIWPIPSF